MQDVRSSFKVKGLRAKVKGWCSVLGVGGLHIGTPRELAEQGIISRFVERPGVVFDKENLSIRIKSM